MKPFAPIFAVACLLLFSDPTASASASVQEIEGKTAGSNRRLGGHGIGGDSTSDDEPTQAPTDAPTEAPTEAPTPTPIPINTFLRLNGAVASCFRDLGEAQRWVQYNKLGERVVLAYTELVNDRTKYSNPNNYQISSAIIFDVRESFRRRRRRLGRAGDERRLRSSTFTGSLSVSGSCTQGGGCTDGTKATSGARRRLTGTLPELPTVDELEAEVVRRIGMIPAQDFDCSTFSVTDVSDFEETLEAPDLCDKRNNGNVKCKGNAQGNP